MNIRVQSSIDLPLAVDLDGTLISADLLWESLFQLLKLNPLFLFLVPVWCLGGKARLKAEIASRIAFDATILPYRRDFLEFLRAEKARGRDLVLVTAAAKPFADAVAAHLGIFKDVYASSAQTNLAGRRKAALLVERYGELGFDYAGNDRADIPVFGLARSAIVVAPDRAAHRFQQQTSARRFDHPKVGLATFVKMLRAHQWLKNLLVFAPAILSNQAFNPAVLFASGAAFIAFCAAASAIYIVNDILDLPLDRRHPKKCHRPFASGVLSIPFGLSVSAGLLGVAAAICLLLPPAFALVIGIYIVATTAYSIAVKRMLLLDVLCLAGLYSLRLIGGKAAAQLPLSFWLIGFCMFFFLSLALVKRYVELQTSKGDERSRIDGRGYRPEDISLVGQSGIASGFTAALVLSLYIQSQELIGYYASPWLIWPLVPIVLYIIIRIWILAYRREMHDDPVVFIATDWRSQLFVGCGALLMIAGSLTG